MTASATTHLAMHPSASEVIIAAADKKGSLGIWRADAASTDDTSDGVLAFGIHQQYVCGLKWAAGGLLTASYVMVHRYHGGPRRCCWLCVLYKVAVVSIVGCDLRYDGSLRLLDVATGVFDLVVGDESREYSAMDAHGSTVLLGDNEGALDVLDVRTRVRAVTAVALHGRKVNTVSVDGDGVSFVTASTDGTVQLWDLRKFVADDSGKGV